MAISKTKQKIITSALNLFNKDGVANVRLQHIADEAGISVGNLAYHYRNKESIIIGVNVGIREEVDQMLRGYSRDQSLKDFDERMAIFYYFMKMYPFYFLDLLELERTFPVIMDMRRKNINLLLKHYFYFFKYNNSIGMIKDATDEYYTNCSSDLWCLMTFWPTRLKVKGEKIRSFEAFRSMVWRYIFPHLTEKGKAVYQNLEIPKLPGLN